MFDKLEEVVARYDELNKMLVSPEILADSKKMIECNKALNEISEIVEKYKNDRFKKIEKNKCNCSLTCNCGYSWNYNSSYAI